MGRKRKKPVTLAEFNGDLGTGTAAATSGTRVKPIKNDKGENPNNIGQRYRPIVYEGLALTARQRGAAEELANAYCNVERLSSGNSGISERVDTSIRVDVFSSKETSAHSRVAFLTGALDKEATAVVEWVIRSNQPLKFTNDPVKAGEYRAKLKDALDRVADKLDRYHMWATADKFL